MLCGFSSIRKGKPSGPQDRYICYCTVSHRILHSAFWGISNHLLMWKKTDLKVSSLKRGRCEYHQGKGWKETGTAVLAFSFSLFPLSALGGGGIRRMCLKKWDNNESTLKKHPGFWKLERRAIKNREDWAAEEQRLGAVAPWQWERNVSGIVWGSRSGKVREIFRQSLFVLLLERET